MTRTMTIFLIVIVIFASGCNEKEPPPQLILHPTSISEPQFEQNSVKVGVLAIQSAVATNSQYGPLMVYLETELNRPFELVPLDQESQFTEVEQHNLDFVLSNPLAAVQIQRLYDTKFMVTLSKVNTGTFFSGLIVVSAQSSIETIDDLYDKRVACVAFETAAGGCIFQMYHLRQLGFDPFEDFASFVETGSQDNIVLGILNGTYDVGFIRTGQLEHMVKEGTLLAISELRIIDQANDDFFFPHTTILYPEWPFAALSQTDEDLIQEVTTALLDMPADHPALTSAGVNGFVNAVDYSSIEELIVELQLRSWDVK